MEIDKLSWPRLADYFCHLRIQVGVRSPSHPSASSWAPGVNSYLDNLDYLWSFKEIRMPRWHSVPIKSGRGSWPYVCHRSPDYSHAQQSLGPTGIVKELDLFIRSEQFILLTEILMGHLPSENSSVSEDDMKEKHVKNLLSPPLPDIYFLEYSK